MTGLGGEIVGNLENIVKLMVQDFGKKLKWSEISPIDLYVDIDCVFKWFMDIFSIIGQFQEHLNLPEIPVILELCYQQPTSAHIESLKIKVQRYLFTNQRKFQFFFT